MTQHETRFAYDKDSGAFITSLSASMSDLTKWAAANNAVLSMEFPALPDPMPALRSDVISRMNVWIEDLMTSITGDVPPTEKVSWPIKTVAAAAHIANTASSGQTALLQAEANQTGETLDELAAKISTQAVAWVGINATITGFRRETSKQIMAAETSEAIESVLTARQTAAMALAVSLGGAS